MDGGIPVLSGLSDKHDKGVPGPTGPGPSNRCRIEIALRKGVTQIWGSGSVRSKRRIWKWAAARVWQNRL